MCRTQDAHESVQVGAFLKPSSIPTDLLALAAMANTFQIFLIKVELEIFDPSLLCLLGFRWRSEGPGSSDIIRV